jgi:hypothetical protein
LDAYLEEELIDLFTHYLQNHNTADLETKKHRMKEIGTELYNDGGNDAMENMFYSVEMRIKEEFGKDIKEYRPWWNGVSEDWKY